LHVYNTTVDEQEACFAGPFLTAVAAAAAASTGCSKPFYVYGASGSKCTVLTITRSKIKFLLQLLLVLAAYAEESRSQLLRCNITVR
jgi:hypothetical protein